MSTHGIIHPRSQGLIDYAYAFAAEAHGDQKRKYTGEPYIIHPLAVAKLVATVTDDCEMICAALLHDVIEDTETTYYDIVDAGFGKTIANLVLELSDVSSPIDGNRAARKAIDRAHTAKASARAKTIKLADLIDNAIDIAKHDYGFAVVYFREKTELLRVLTEGDKTLYARAQQLVDEFYTGNYK